MQKFTPKTFSTNNLSANNLDVAVQPSTKCIDFILGYSKAVQVKQSKVLNADIVLVKN